MTSLAVAVAPTGRPSSSALGQGVLRALDVAGRLQSGAGADVHPQKSSRLRAPGSRFIPLLLLLLLAALGTSGCAGSAKSLSSQDKATLSTVRRELKKRYDDNRRAFFAKDLPAIMALRTEDFVAVTPDSSQHDRAEMEETTRGLLDDIDRWISLTFQIDSFVHHVESWVTQRETWRKTPEGWKLARVDNIRNQRRLIDGRPG